MQSPHGFSGGTRWGQEGGSPLGGTLLSCSPGAADEDYQQLLHCCQYCCELQAAEPWEGAQGYPQTPQPLGAHGGATQSHTPPVVPSWLWEGCACWLPPVPCPPSGPI